MGRFVGTRRLKVLNLLILFIKICALTMYVLVSAFTLICGKSKTGIKRDYLFFSILIMGVLFNL